jgi:hypothetical protein
MNRLPTTGFRPNQLHPCGKRNENRAVVCSNRAFFAKTFGLQFKDIWDFEIKSTDWYFEEE